MPCTVKKTFRAAAEARGHLLVQVKENQSGLLRSIKAATAGQAPLGIRETIDANKRTRHEVRQVEVFDAGPALKGTDWNEVISHIVRVTRTTLVRRSQDGLWDKRAETALYVCSAPIGADKAAAAIRAHWGIENRNHYVRDVSMLEDASRIRSNPGIFARIRSFALNILRANGETNIANALWTNALDINKPIGYRFK